MAFEAIYWKRYIHPLSTPPDLLKAHQNLDCAVLKLYGFGKGATKAEIVAGLMERYQDLKGKEI